MEALRRTIQSMGSSSFLLNTSRHTRRIMFRVTARCASRLAITSPKRACDKALCRAYSMKCSVLLFGFKRKTDEKSSVLTRRRSREKCWVTRQATATVRLIQPDVCGLWHGGHSAQRGHFSLPYGHGNRGYAYGVQLMVDKYVS